MFCTECGKQLNENQRFCTNCGSSVEDHPSPVGASIVPPPLPATIKVGRPPASRSSAALAENPAPVNVPELPLPIPVTPPAPPKTAPQQPDPTTAFRKAMRFPFMLVGIGLLVLVAAAALILYMRSGRHAIVSDAEIEKSIRARFGADPNLSKYSVIVRSENGIVTLTGSVGNVSDRSVASHMVLEQPGVKTIVDDLVLTTDSQGTPRGVKTERDGAGESSGLSQFPTKTVLVDGKLPWTDTGIDIAVGELVSVIASGNVSFSTGGQGIGPQGDQPSCAVFRNPRVPYLARDLRCHSLIARIGSVGAFFEVGSSTQFRASAAGRLYLGVNDNFFPDNSGNWTAVISEHASGLVTAVTPQNSITGTLHLFEPQIDPAARTLVLNGVDTARPSVPFHFDWGDGSESVGFFPQTKVYEQGGRTYTINVVATYPDGTHGSAETVARIP